MLFTLVFMRTVFPLVVAGRVLRAVAKTVGKIDTIVTTMEAEKRKKYLSVDLNPDREKCELNTLYVFRYDETNIPPLPPSTTRAASGDLIFTVAERALYEQYLAMLSFNFTCEPDQRVPIYVDGARLHEVGMKRWSVPEVVEEVQANMKATSA